MRGGMPGLRLSYGVGVHGHGAMKARNQVNSAVRLRPIGSLLCGGPGFHLAHILALVRRCLLVVMGRRIPNWLNIGPYIITSTILGVPYYNYKILGPKSLF